MLVPSRLLAAGAALLALLGARPAAGQRSLLPNAGFECGRDGWVLGWGPKCRIGVDPKGAHSGVQDASLPHGAWLSTTWVPLAADTGYTVQVYARGSGTLLLQLKNANGTFAGGPIHQQSVTVPDDGRFHPCQLTFRTGDRPDSALLFFGSFGQDMTVDDVSLVAASGPVAFRPRADAEFGLAGDAPYGVVTLGQPAALTVTASRPGVPATYLCRLDESGHQWGAARVPFHRAAGGVWQARYVAPGLPPGYWHFVTSATPRAVPAAGRVEGETFLSVVPPMPTAPLRDWFFGTHVPAGDDAMQLACWRMGLRWDRLHDTDQRLDWANFEPQKGQWHPDAAGVAWHRGTAARPVGVLGDIDKDGLPGWVPEADPKFARSLNNLPASEGQPGADWAAFCAEVARQDAAALATPFGGGAPAAVEISNEPDNPYVAGWDPPLSGAAYVQELGAAYRAIKAADPAVRVVAQASFAYPDGGVFWDEIAAGLTDVCDVVTYHGYGFDIDGGPTGADKSGGKSPRYGGAYQRAAVRQLQAEMGPTPRPIWGDEAGMYGMASCYEKFAFPLLLSATATLPGAFHGVPNRPYNSLAYDEARAYAESACVTRSSGTQRMFYYESQGIDDEGAERHTDTIRWGDVNDVLKEPMQALAVAISLLQNTAFTAGSHDDRTGLVHLTYAGPAGRRLDVFWLDPGHAVPVSVPLPHGASSLLTMWGRPTPRASRLTVTQDPVYVVSRR